MSALAHLPKRRHARTAGSPISIFDHQVTNRTSWAVSVVKMVLAKGKIVPLVVAFMVVVLAEEEFDFDLSQFGEELYERKQSEKQLVGSSDEDDTVNAEELGSFVEGDIYQPLVLKNAYKFKSKRWKNAVVPYEISEEFSEYRVVQMIIVIGTKHDHNLQTSSTCSRSKTRSIRSSRKAVFGLYRVTPSGITSRSRGLGMGVGQRWVVPGANRS